MDNRATRNDPEVGVPFDLTLAGPFDGIVGEVDVTFTNRDRGSLVLPAFQAGDGAVRVRFAAPIPGGYDYITRSSDGRVDGIEGRFEARPYAGANPLYSHGRLQVVPSGRTLEHTDGTPFLWIGDTWWMGLTSRLPWPDDFGHLLSDRVGKGFSVVQIVAGPMPDFPATPDGIWHPQQANEAGWPWHPGWEGINPAFYDRADQRIAALVDAGVVPCIVGMWGYYLTPMGIDRVRSHWRNLVARYAAYPVVFCVAGEMNYPARRPDEDLDALGARRSGQVAGWRAILDEVRRIDPFRNLVTAHPAYPDARRNPSNPSGLDINMVQTSHWSYHAPAPDEVDEMTQEMGLSEPIRLGFDGAIELVAAAVAQAPAMPVVNAEPCYEGIMGGNWEDVQRFLFWSGMLSGLAGSTYGANGIWQLTSDEDASASVGSSWGTATWREAMHYPGSRHVGLGRRILERFRWWDLRPIPSEPCARADRLGLFAAVNTDVAIYYLPSGLIDDRLRGMRGLAIDVSWAREPSAWFIDPRTGRDHRSLAPIAQDADGTWLPPECPSREDWLLVVESGPGPVDS